ncbi:FkbM family methyltransferase [Desulfospira joergensenii]|uniref:FkbM family methyltransferase n=1 Tax=Desulfospira joergensenii TaxID=53329 RepID=UPI0003B70D1A|nr:FkbM family methyltransferase [Desulfospira joergensenii]
MELTTKFLFNLLLRIVKPEIVCDIGSMDGADALRFKRILPASQGLIFEANPYNFAAICQDSVIKEKSILLFNEIVWNENCNKSFYIVKPSDIKGVDEHLRGTSSVFLRNAESEKNRIQLRGVRLDSKISGLGALGNIALWIDVEGASYEVLEGIRGIRDRVKLIHAEVETQMVWKGQKTRSDVLALAESMGYVLLGHGRNKQQHDVVLIDKDLFDSAPKTFKFITFMAFLKALPIKRLFKHFRKTINF